MKKCSCLNGKVLECLETALNQQGVTLGNQSGNKPNKGQVKGIQKSESSPKARNRLELNIEKLDKKH